MQKIHLWKNVENKFKNVKNVKKYHKCKKYIYRKQIILMYL